MCTCAWSASQPASQPASESAIPYLFRLHPIPCGSYTHVTHSTLKLITIPHPAPTHCTYTSPDTFTCTYTHTKFARTVAFFTYTFIAVAYRVALPRPSSPCMA